MDNKLKKIFEAESKLIDAELEEEKEQLLRESLTNPLSPSSMRYLDAIHIAEEKAQRRKELLKAKLVVKVTKSQEQSQTKWYVYDHIDKTFQISEKGSLNFKTKRGKYYQSTLFEILLEHWEKDKSRPSVMTKSEIIPEVSKRLHEDWDLDKLRSNLGHLEEKIKTNPKIANLITFDRHHRKRIVFDIHNPYRS